jgi:hypothetical protein
MTRKPLNPRGLTPPRGPIGKNTREGVFVPLALGIAGDTSATPRESPRHPTPSTNPPPYCYLQPGTSPEAAALACVKALHIEVPVDALAILWELRRSCRTSHEEDAGGAVQNSKRLKARTAS